MRLRRNILRSCFVDASRCCFLWLSRFLLIVEVWPMHRADTQCMVEGREEAKEQEKNVLLKFFLSCHKM